MQPDTPPARPAVSRVPSMAAAPLEAPASPALRLLRHEAEVRRLASEEELLYHLVNSVRALALYGSATLLRRRRSNERLRVALMSDLPEVDRDAPLTRALEERLVRLDQRAALAEPAAFAAHDPTESPRVRIVVASIEQPRGRR